MHIVKVSDQPFNPPCPQAERVEAQKREEAEEKAKKEEEERQRRKDRVAAIMARTRGAKGATPTKVGRGEVI